MPRSIFNATISFGLVNVPIKLYSATESKTVHFREVHEADGAKIEHRRIDPETGDVVPYDDIVKGYEVAQGEFVELSKEEIAAAAGEKTKRIAIDEFVPAGAIDPVFYEKTYYVGCREGGADAYRTLHAALAQTERAGIGHMTYHNREYLVAIRALDDVIALHTMRFADELVPGDELDAGEPEKGPSQREVKMAGSLVDALAAEFKPEEQRDTYRESVLAMIDAKAKGKQVVRAAPDEPAEETDLLAALQASVKGAKG
ncbi:MAG TPA: Ku protein [Solirubrobacteraceae bacterium]|nr:Ku protein [Solirubrobacteraceae bacterium]